MIGENHGRFKENKFSEKAGVCCQEKVICNSYQGFFCAVKWMRYRLKPFIETIVSEMFMDIQNNIFL